jgi:hypothetical protein
MPSSSTEASSLLASILQDICKPLGVHYYIGKGYPPVGPKGPHKVEKGKYPSGLWCFLRVWLRLVILGLPIDEPPAFIRPVENMRKVRNTGAWQT